MGPGAGLPSSCVSQDCPWWQISSVAVGGREAERLTISMIV